MSYVHECTQLWRRSSKPYLKICTTAELIVRHEIYSSLLQISLIATRWSLLNDKLNFFSVCLLLLESFVYLLFLNSSSGGGGGGVAQT